MIARSNPALRLDNQLCFAIGAASRAIVAAYGPLLEPLGLTHPQYLVMLVLWEQPRDASALRVKDIGDRLFLDSGTLTPLLKRLESRGLVARRRAIDDERVVEVHLTAEGRALYTKATAIPHAVACAAGLDLTQLEALRESLKAVAGQLRANSGD